MSVYELDSQPTAHSSPDLIKGGNSIAYAVTAGLESGTETVYSSASARLPLNGLDPVPFGLIAFGSTNLLLSLTGIAARGVTIPNIIVAQAFLGGVGQVLAGIMCGILGQTSNFATFSTFGFFWIGYTYSLSTISGVQGAYSGTGQMGDAFGLFLIVWFIIASVYTFACHRSNAFLIGLLFFLSLSYLFAALSSFSAVGTMASRHFAVAGGASGIVSAGCAFYLAVAGLLKADTPMRMPICDLGMRRNSD